MKIPSFVQSLFPSRENLTAILAGQSELLVEASGLLVRMLSLQDLDEWKSVEREIKSLEVKGDALLTEFREQLTARPMGSAHRSADLQTVAMALDDFLDVIKDSSKAVLIYAPRKIDSQLRELAGLISSEAQAISSLIPLLADIKRNPTAISHHCDRVTELEHAADDAYEDYIGFIFREEDDFREMTKYKNLAELLEKATDSGKHISDCIRLMVLRYLHE